MSLPPLSELVACPHCDTLHRATALKPGQTARCKRCHVVLQTSRPRAVVTVISLAVAAVVLMIAAISFPFMDLDASGNKNATSVISAILAFNTGLSVPLVVVVALFIVVLPLTRLIAIIYALGPLARGGRPHRLAKPAFLLAETLRPWAMAEIFMVGVTVALIKVAGLANVTLGPAFWAFATLVVLTIVKDQLINRYTIWEALDHATQD